MAEAKCPQVCSSAFLIKNSELVDRYQVSGLVVSCLSSYKDLGIIVNFSFS